MKKKRLDEILLERGLVKDKKDAFIQVTEGFVIVEEQKAIAPSQIFPHDIPIRIRKRKQYVGRGALKLEAALGRFHVDIKDKICLDIGACTGGFTEVLLNHGAKLVYAIDTAFGKLDLKIRQNQKVSVMEKTDIRSVTGLPRTPQIATIDVSLIPLKEILPHAHRLISEQGEVIALLKPQYETRNPRILHHGVIRDTEARQEVLENSIETAKNLVWEVIDYMKSPIKGGQGNVEYLLYLRKTH
jgi:23S rRNA (cytidine1920-2'-O)/16S rRNA (cytidine1409-2'-O)-methyltransferase